MAVDPQGNDLQSVRIPITGKIAWAPLDAANVVTPADGGDRSLALLTDYPAYKLLGLIKTDGGFEPTAETGDATEFFQDGYKLFGESTLSEKVGLAQSDRSLVEFLTGKTFDANGHIYVSDAFTDKQFLIFREVLYKSGDIERRNGVAQFTEVAQDKDERGTVRGFAVAYEWQRSDLFGGEKYSQWDLPVVAVGS
ncbi:MAG: hypothetical protein LBK54_10310 [Propionibacteriaceae bacterium]|nr:hypothetical protein [Propionibacteriaceae bacterium]